VAVPGDDDRRRFHARAVGITQVQTPSVSTTRGLLAGAVLTGLPVAVIYLIFQRRVTQAITLRPASRADSQRRTATVASRRRVRSVITEV